MIKRIDNADQLSLIKALFPLLEAAILLLLIVAMWQPSPPYRDQWVWLLWLALPIFRLRVMLYDRLYVPTPLNRWLLVFIVLTGINYSLAPMAPESYVVLLSRPLLGMWIYLYMVDHAYTCRHMRWLWGATLGLSATLTTLALLATQWIPEKNLWLAPISERLPRLLYTSDDLLLYRLQLSYNPNEVSGAMLWLVPILYALMLTPLSLADRRARWAVRIIAGMIFALMLFAMLLSQSRIALLSIFVVLALVSMILIKRLSGRYLAIAGVVVGVVITLGVLFNPFGVFPRVDWEWERGLTHRDTKSIQSRLDLWQSAVAMLRDYPLTGMGLSMYKIAAWSTPEYIVPTFARLDYPPPHAHNEYLHMGADMGLPGLAVYITWQVVILSMLWHNWRNGDPNTRRLAVGLFGGLLAHALFGLADAIPIWDRFAFILWWVVGLVGAQYTLVKHQDAATTADTLT